MLTPLPNDDYSLPQDHDAYRCDDISGVRLIPELSDQVPDLTHLARLLPPEIEDLTPFARLLPPEIEDLTRHTSMLPPEIEDLTRLTSLLPPPPPPSNDVVEALSDVYVLEYLRCAA
jgi:hypothetical protein